MRNPIWWKTLNLTPMDGAIGAVKSTLCHRIEEEMEKHEPPIVTLKKDGTRLNVKHDPDEIWNKKDKYLDGFQWYQWTYLTSNNGVISKMHIECEHYIKDRAETLINYFLLFTHKTIERAILETETLTDLWNEFYEWFLVRKRAYMEKMEVEIKKENKVKEIKTVNSHGGVANLLKVLTKTMQAQGADIRNIAKMQWMICRQANVLLPDEFLTDVSTVLDMEETAKRDFG